MPTRIPEEPYILVTADDSEKRRGFLEVRRDYYTLIKNFDEQAGSSLKDRGYA